MIYFQNFGLMTVFEVILLTLQLFTGKYRDVTGKLGYRDFKFIGISVE